MDTRQAALVAVLATATAVVWWRVRRRQHRIVRRAALDIGSGQHKMLIADVDVTPRGTKIVKILHSVQRQVLLSHDLVGRGEDTLSEEILRQSRDVIGAFCAMAREWGAVEVAGVGTAVFRKARNGRAYLRSLREALGVRVEVVPQDEEGELGFLTALSSGYVDRRDLVAWDSGSGSFQITGVAADALGCYEGPLGDSRVTQMLLDLAGVISPRASTGLSASPNPVKLEHARALVIALRDSIPPPPDWLLRKVARPETTVVAIGERTSIFYVAASILGTNFLHRTDVWSAVERVANRDDADLAAALPLFGEEAMAVPKLCLLYSVMEVAGMESVTFVQTMGSCEGILLAGDVLWSQQ